MLLDVGHEIWKHDRWTALAEACYRDSVEANGLILWGVNIEGLPGSDLPGPLHLLVCPGGDTGALDLEWNMARYGAIVQQS